MSTSQQNQQAQQAQDQKAETPEQAQAKEKQAAAPADVDGLAGKKPEELTPEELRLMADTMPGEGPGD
jgi:hypothetical protein